MIRITLFRNPKTDLIFGYSVSGHAGYDDYGKDIICAAVSVLATNTDNSIETLCRFKPLEEVGDGFLSVIFPDLQKDDISFSDIRIVKADVLMNAMLLGFKSIQEEYGTKYLGFEEKTEQNA